VAIVAGSADMVAGSALFEVSLGGRIGDHCEAAGAAGQTYLHGLDHIHFVVGLVGIRNVLVPVWEGSKCSCRWSKTWLLDAHRSLILPKSS
jgi:hypothetical protein